jgi:hypothetical protein
LNADLVDWWGAFMETIVMGCDTLSVQDVGTTLWAYAKMNLQLGHVMKLFPAVSRLSDSTNAQDVNSILRALAKLNGGLQWT